MSSNVKLLDATLRDGGQGLDDLFNNGFSDKYYTEEAKHRVIDLLGGVGSRNYRIRGDGTFQG